MKLRYYLTLLCAASQIAFASASAEEAPTIGVVNVRECIESSKLGLQGQSELEKTKKQMDETLDKITGELVDMGTKLDDADYVDSLSPDKEKELRAGVQQKSIEKAKFENQYYQVMTQANNTFVHKVLNGINKASEKVAKDHKLRLIVDAETCFFFNPSIDVTASILEEMNKSFDLEQEAQSSNEA